MIVRRPSGFIAPCQPSKVARPPSGPLWVHEIKHDGYRLMVRRDGARVRCFTRNGHDWADRFPAIVEAALRIQASSFMLDGEAVVVSDDGRPDFHALRTRRTGHAVVLYAFDLIEHDGDDLRKLPLIERKWRLFKLIGKSQRRAIRFVEHLTGDGPTVFEHVCRMGLEGIVSKRTDAPYRSGPSMVWLKSKNPASEAVRREEGEYSRAENDSGEPDRFDDESRPGSNAMLNCLRQANDRVDLRQALIATPQCLGRAFDTRPQHRAVNNPLE
jgi:bifunctional non-homologous end joining protein LigD